jgi:hypothetical protein
MVPEPRALRFGLSKKWGCHSGENGGPLIMRTASSWGRGNSAGGDSLTRFSGFVPQQPVELVFGVPVVVLPGHGWVSVVDGAYRWEWYLCRYRWSLKEWRRRSCFRSYLCLCLCPHSRHLNRLSFRRSLGRMHLCRLQALPP